MLRQSLLALGLAIATGSAFAAQAGHVVFVAGAAQVAARPATLDAPVQEGDELSTGADGYLYMKTVDNGFLILRPNSKARVTAYHVDEANPANTRVKLELLNGVARSISGAAVKQARQNFRFNTPVAAIGVRGTDFIVHTNEKSSWVSVVSGGVVVSGFAGACGPDGIGPCEGTASRELFAGRPDVMLQVQRGQQVPQLLQSTTIVPELNVPARSDEPVGKTTGVGIQGGTAVNLDPQKADSLATVHPIAPPPPPPAPPPLVEVGPPPPKVQEVFWGRWQAVAGLTEMPGRLNDTGMEAPVFVGPYAISRLKNTALVMPKEGTVSFQLGSSEAIMQKSNGSEAVAKIDSGQLNINFVDRSFTTGLVVKAGSDVVDVKGGGVIGLTGAMYSNSSSDTFIRGYLGGAKADEAAYIFKNSMTPGITVSGITTWAHRAKSRWATHAEPWFSMRFF